MASIFGRMKIGGRLIAAFAIAMACSLGLGIYALHATSTIAQANTDMYVHPFTVTNTLREINTHVVAMHRSMKDVALAAEPAQMDAALADVDTREKLVLDRFQLLRERFLGNPADIDQLKAAFVDWRPIRQAVVQKFRESKREEAGAITKTQGAQKVKEIEDRINAILTVSMSKAAGFREKTQATAENLEIGVILGLALSVLISAAGAFLIHRSIVRPVKGITDTMAAMSAGNYAINVAGCDRHDELGEMANAVAGFKEQLMHARTLEAEQEKNRLQAEADRRKAMHDMADAFERTVGHVVEALTASATELKSSSDVMSAAASDTSSQVTTVASAAHQASTNVQTVASATEELAASIKEIDTQVKRSHEAAGRARDEAARTTTQIRTLSDNVNKIGEIVTLINSIAAQTNLLALNATIEAARAGEAGKGFAVVASEVKSLANQTAKATEEISSQIAAVQQGTTESVTAIDAIARVIAELGEVSAVVSSAVEQQAGATNEIARNVEQAAAGTEEVSSNIAMIEDATRKTGRISGSIQTTSDHLSEKSGALQREMQRFLDNVRRG